MAGLEAQVGASSINKFMKTTTEISPITWLQAIVIIAAGILFSGCAYLHSTTYRSTVTSTNGVVTVTEVTKARATTFFDAQSQLARFKNGSDISLVGSNRFAAGTYLVGLDQSSSTTNLNNIINAVVAGAVQGAVQATSKP